MHQVAHLNFKAPDVSLPHFLRYLEVYFIFSWIPKAICSSFRCQPVEARNRRLMHCPSLPRAFWALVWAQCFMPEALRKSPSKLGLLHETCSICVKGNAIFCAKPQMAIFCNSRRMGTTKNNRRCHRLCPLTNKDGCSSFWAKSLDLSLSASHRSSVSQPVTFEPWMLICWQLDPSSFASNA